MILSRATARNPTARARLARVARSIALLTSVLLLVVAILYLQISIRSEVDICLSILGVVLGALTALSVIEAARR